MLAVGSQAPEFFLPDQLGTTRSLKGAPGRWVVLWWYPRASSRTCTLQGHAFQSLSKEFALSGAIIYGASFNSVTENKSFAEHEQFDFPLLADTSMKVGHAYGVTRELDDPAVNKPRRITYLIDPDQIVRQVYVVEDAGPHPQQVLLDLRALQGQVSRPEG
ncbi:MAG TPA: peroxiredoxin [Streptosporangiaceae bacterium]|nr:peroxiredoxin [Streptosporangiaceae bacterium]